MRITLLGIVGYLVAAALLVYLGYELHHLMATKPQDPPRFYPPVTP